VHCPRSRRLEPVPVLKLGLAPTPRPPALYRVTDPVTVMHPFIVTFTDIAKFIIRFIINQ